MRGCERRRFRLGLLVVASMLVSREAVADTSYHIGNSLTWDMYNGGLQQVAGSFGVSLTPSYHIRSSWSLVYMLNNPSDVTFASPSIWPTALPSQPWNFVAFQPFPDPSSPSTLQSDITAAQTFIGLAKTSSPAPVFFIYEAWPGQADFVGDYDTYWKQAVPNTLTQRTILARQYFDALHQRLASLYGDTVAIHVIPVGDVFARINQRIVAGDFSAAGNIADFYRDSLHMGAAGRYTAALTAFATMYGRNPVGAPYAAAQLPNNGAVNLTPQVAQEIASIVWDVVTSDTRTGVSPIRVAPASISFQATRVGAHDQPQTLTVSNVTARSIAIDAITVSDNFLQTNTCGTSLPANSQCSVTLTFAPTTAGAHSGTLTIQSADVPYTVHLTGSAPVEATISASTTAAAVGDLLTLTWNSSAGATCEGRSDAPGTPWTGNITPGGTRTFTESAAATIAYSIHCAVSGAADEASASTSVVWSWPAVEVILSANPTAVEVGQPTSITWTSSGATACAASGGGSGDGWAGAKATAGTQSITQSGTSADLTFTLSCSSSLSGLSKSASVTVAQSVPVKSGGGGAMDFVSLIGVALWWWRRRAEFGFR